MSFFSSKLIWNRKRVVGTIATRSVFTKELCEIIIKKSQFLINKSAEINLIKSFALLHCYFR